MQSDSWAAYARTWVAEGFGEFIKTAVNPHLGIKEERSGEMGEVVRVITVVRKEGNIRKEIEDKGGSGTSRYRIRLLLGIVIGCWRHSEPFKQPPITAPHSFVVPINTLLQLKLKTSPLHANFLTI